MSAESYGVDYSAFAAPDGGQALDTTFAEQTGIGVLVEDVVKTVLTDAGALPWAPAATFNLRSLLNATLSTAERTGMERMIDGLFSDDQRMSVATGLTFAGRTLTARFVVTPADGSPSFVANIVINSDGTVAEPQVTRT